MVNDKNQRKDSISEERVVRSCNADKRLCQKRKDNTLMYKVMLVRTDL